MKKEQRVIYSREIPFTEKLTDHIEKHLKDGFFITSVIPQNVVGTGNRMDGGLLIIFEKMHNNE
jgi:hypothetical protein